MTYINQFKKFDPMSGKIPSTSPIELSSIVLRARDLLKGRSREELISAAHTVDWFIEDFFTRSKNAYVGRLLERGGWELGLLPEDEQTEEGVLWLLDNWRSVCDEVPPAIASEDNMGELDALKECINDYIFDDIEFKNAKDYEYFAVLSLWFVVDCLECLGELPRDDLPWGLLDLEKDINLMLDKVGEEFDKVCEQEGIVRSDLKLTLSQDSRIRRSLRLALDAMDAVCYAEHLKEAGQLYAQVCEMRSEVEKMSVIANSMVEAKVKEKMSVSASKAARQRHQKSRELRELAISIYISSNDWKSVRQAAKTIYPKLIEEGRKIGFTFSADRGEQTTYEWLLSARQPADV